MTLETFFEKFDLFADAPDAVAKMRELVLHFAVSGQLSERKVDDAPVSELLSALARGKSQRGRNGRRSSATPITTEGAGDRPINAPDHWAWVPLNDIGAMSGGMTPSKAKSVFWDGDVNWFSSKDIKTDELTESELKITREAAESTGLQIYPPGSLVMVARSGILKRTFPVSILRGDGTVNQDLKVLSPFVGGIERYIQIMLRGMTDFILTSLVKTGMTVQSLKYEEFEVQPFPFPPLAEQKRIVAKVDELMALCDRLEAQQQEREMRHAALARASLARFADAPTPANLDFLFHPSYAIPPADLRKSILTLAVQGKLVPQDPNDEPAEELVERLARELSPENRRRQASPLPPLDVESLQYELPESWTWARFRDVAIIASNLVKPDDFLDFTHLAPDNIEKGNGVLLPCSTVREDKVISSNHRFYPGQIIYSKIRPNLAKVVVVDFEGLCSADMYPIDALIDSTYLQHYMLSESFLVQAVKTDTRVAMPKINQTELNALAVPIPPLAEQRRIVAKVDELMAWVDALETQLATARTTATALLAAALAELTSASANGAPQTSPGHRPGSKVPKNIKG